MPDRTIIRGDSYALRRPLWVITLVDNIGNPFDLTGCTVRTTYKSTITSPDVDGSDDQAAIKHHIIIDGAGNVTASVGLVLVGPATDGQLEEHLTAAESRILPLNTRLLSDVEVTDGNGEIFTVLFADALKTQDGITHRLT